MSRSRPTKDCGERLLKFIADFANWDNAANDGLSGGRAGRLVSEPPTPSETPLVVDPFAGGGSIPVGGPAPRL